MHGIEVQNNKEKKKKSISLRSSSHDHFRHVLPTAWNQLNLFNTFNQKPEKKGEETFTEKAFCNKI
jgi:hypothetical protein